MKTAIEMIRVIKEDYGLDSPKIFSAMLRVPREEFVPQKEATRAYEDSPISIGFGQTISQPYTVAFMIYLLGLKGGEKVLEIGTGSGYQTAILSLLAKYVYTIEIVPDLAYEADRRLKRLGFKNIEVRVGSGEKGWKEKSPFGAIIITAGVEDVPKELFNELTVGGVLVAPVGRGEDKTMTRYTKTTKDIKKEEFGIFHFVPFTSVAPREQLLP